jgi:CMP-N-acetylneuraminic acid synthetase
MRVLGFVPARGGSKGIPRKNIRPLNGKPLLQYTAESALAAKRLSRVILSTDDAEIAEVGRRCGLDVPFMRPAELAQDDTPTLPVVQHALRWLEERGEHYDAMCLLQPTHPIRRAEDIDGCIDLLERTPATAVITILPVPPEYNPHWVYFQSDGGFLQISTGDKSPISRRQALPPAFHREGSVYVTRSQVIMEANSLYGDRLVGYPVDRAQRVDIDTLDDWAEAERLLCQK